MIRRRALPVPRPAMTLVETALVLSATLVFILGIFEYCRYVFVLQVVENAAREGARYAVVHTYDGTTAQVQDVVDEYLAGQGAQLQGYSKATSIQVYKTDASSGASTGAWTDAAFGECIAVEITGNFKPVLPTFLFMGSTIPVTGRTVMYSEAN